MSYRTTKGKAIVAFSNPYLDTWEKSVARVTAEAVGEIESVMLEVHYGDVYFESDFPVELALGTEVTLGCSCRNKGTTEKIFTVRVEFYDPDGIVCATNVCSDYVAPGAAMSCETGWFSLDKVGTWRGHITLYAD